MARARIRGIDEPLPEGETLLWEGRPDARALARHAFRVHWIGGYFVVLAALAAVASGPGAPAAARVVWLLVLGGIVVAMGAGYAALTARTTVYAFTDRRVVMKVGVAFPAVFNLPYSRVGGAWARVGAGGVGDVALDTTGSDRMGYVFLWPHARPWRFTRPQPMLRSIPDAARVSERLREALLAAGVGTGEPVPATPVEYSVLDDDGIVILSNRPPRAAPAASREPS